MIFKRKKWNRDKTYVGYCSTGQHVRLELEGRSTVEGVIQLQLCEQAKTNDLVLKLRENFEQSPH